jgi:hypothetical protein
MFLFAKLVMQNLLAQKTLSGLNEELSAEKFPGRGDLKKA